MTGALTQSNTDFCGSCQGTRILIQRNPRSGSGRGRRELIALCRELRRMNFRVRMYASRTQLDARAAQLKPDELRCIVAAGGDGTVADLLNRHPRVPLAILPLGTENLTARYLEYPLSGSRLAHSIQRGRTARFDTVVANGQRFLIMLSCGVDAEIVRDIHRTRTGTIRRIAYVWPTVKAFLTSRPRPYRIQASDAAAPLSGSHIIVSNAPVYGFSLPFCPNASMNDGLLDVRVFTGMTRAAILLQALRLRLRMKSAESHVIRFQTASATIEAEQNDFQGCSQTDGDPGPPLPLRIQVDPLSLTLLLP